MWIHTGISSSAANKVEIHLDACNIIVSLVDVSRQIYKIRFLKGNNKIIIINDYMCFLGVA